MTRQATIGWITGGVVVACVLGYFIVQTKNQQAATQAQLDAMKRQMAGTTQAAIAPAATAQDAGALPTLTPGALDGTALAKQKVLQEYLTEGFKLLDTRDPQNALHAAQIFQEGLDKVDPKNIFFHNGLGRSLLIAGKYDEALAAFKRGREVDPKRAELVSGEGWAYWNLKRFPEAKQAWEDAVKLDPNSQDAWMVLSWIYLALGQDEMSKQGFVVLLKIDSTNKQWTFGLNMARGNNHNIDQIRTEFKGMPDPEVFSAPASHSAD